MSFFPSLKSSLSTLAATALALGFAIPVTAHADTISFDVVATNGAGVMVGTGELLIHGVIASSGTSTFSSILATSGGSGGPGCTYDCSGGGGGGTTNPGGGTIYAGGVDLFEVRFGTTAPYVYFDESMIKGTETTVVFTNGVLTAINYDGSIADRSLYTGQYSTGPLKYSLNLQGVKSIGTLSFSLTPSDPTDPSDPAAPSAPVPPSAVTPEPSSLLLLATGMLGTATAIRRRVRGRG